MRRENEFTGIKNSQDHFIKQAPLITSQNESAY